MLLPNADQAVIPAEKLRDYLLNEAHVENGGKARYFMALGYRRGEWERLDQDLRDQVLTSDALQAESDEFGQKWTIEAPLQGPTGRGRILSVWIFRHGEDFPRFVTARPVTGRQAR